MQLDLGSDKDSLDCINLKSESYLRINKTDFNNLDSAPEHSVLQFNIHLYYSSPTVFYWFTDTLNSYGFKIERPAKYKRHAKVECFEIKLNDAEDNSLLSVGKLLAEMRFPNLIAK